MTRAEYIKHLDGWLSDVRKNTLSEFDKGTPAPLCLAFGQHDVYKSWVKSGKLLLDTVLPPTLFPMN